MSEQSSERKGPRRRRHGRGADGRSGCARGSAPSSVAARHPAGGQSVHLAAGVPARDVRGEAPRVLVVSVGARAGDALPTVAQRRVDPQHPAQWRRGDGRGGRRDRGVWRLRGRRQLRRRRGRVSDPRVGQLHRDHQGRGSDLRGRCALHLGLDARQADGDRFRPRRRAHRREDRPQAAPGGADPGGLPRLHGRCVEVRPRRRDRWPGDHGHQRDRGDHHRGAAARPVAAAVRGDLLDPVDRRRARLAASGPAGLDRGRPARHPRQQRRVRADDERVGAADVAAACRVGGGRVCSVCSAWCRGCPTSRCWDSRRWRDTPLGARASDSEAR